MQKEEKHELCLLWGHDTDTCAYGVASCHCITCADDMLPVRVVHVNKEAGLALVAVQNQVEEVDITLVEHVEPGDLLLVHGGVAIDCVDEMMSENEPAQDVVSEPS